MGSCCRRRRVFLLHIQGKLLGGVHYYWLKISKVFRNKLIIFYLQWQDELYIDENKATDPDIESKLDNTKIKATSIVILYDDRTSRIVSFDVEPGFEHQWGYGRHRFMAKKTLSGES